MLRITFPYLMFISMTALAGAVLNSFRHFGLPALTPVLHNLGVIAGMLLLASLFDCRRRRWPGAWWRAGALQLLVLWPAMGRLGLRTRLKFNPRHEGVRRVMKLMLPTIFSSSVAQVNLLVGTVFASLLVAEAQSWLYYSDRLTELPLGLFGVAIGTVILPQLSRHHADADAEGYSKSLDWGLRMVLLVGMPAALGLALLSEPLTASLFRYGKFTDEDTRMVGYALTAMSLGIPTFMLSKVLLPAFYARQDTQDADACGGDHRARQRAADDRDRHAAVDEQLPRRACRHRRWRPHWPVCSTPACCGATCADRASTSPSRAGGRWLLRILVGFAGDGDQRARRARVR